MKRLLQYALLALTFSTFITTLSSAQYTSPEQAVPPPSDRDQLWLFEQGLDLSNYQWNDPVLNQHIALGLRKKKQSTLLMVIGGMAASTAITFLVLSSDVKKDCNNGLCDIFIADPAKALGITSAVVGGVFLIGSGSAKAKSRKQLELARQRMERH